MNLIELARGAAELPLARRCADRIGFNIESSAARARIFASIQDSVGIVNEDTGEAITLRFDAGQLTIHRGSIGVIAVTICGTTEALEAIFTSHEVRPLDLLDPLPRGKRARESVVQLFHQQRRGRLMVFGWATRPRLVVRVIRLLGL